jgi:hypothetical protein
MHGYEMTSYDTTEDIGQLSTQPNRSPIRAGENIVRTITEAIDWAKVSLAHAQQESEYQANKERKPAPLYKKEDQVWLSLRIVRTDRPSRKPDWKNVRYQVIEVMDTHNVRLNTPPGIYPVFHVDLLRPAGYDKLPSQAQADYQPPPIKVDGEEEYYVDRIIKQRTKKVGRGQQSEYLVKWTGYAKPTWEPAKALEDTEAARVWEEDPTRRNSSRNSCPRPNRQRRC